MSSVSKIVVETSDGEIEINQSGRTFPPVLTIRKYGYVDGDRVWAETDSFGEPNPRAGQPIQERRVVEEFTHRLSPQSTKELLKALQYYS